MKNIVINPTSQVAQQPAKSTEKPAETVAKTKATTQGVSFTTGKKDPHIAELESNGYNVVEKSKYGVIAQKDKGNKVFLAHTENGYMEERVRVALTLPESIQKKVKIKCTEEGSTVIQYISELILADLKSKKII